MRTKNGCCHYLFAAMILTGGLASCGRNAYKPPPAPKVTVSKPVQQSVVDYMEFTGNTQAINTVKLRARVEGYLEKVLFQDGDYVKKDQLLFLIQQNTYEAKLKAAEAQILANKAVLEHAETEFKRYTELVKKSAAPQTDLDRWHYERDAALANVMQAEAQRDLAKLNLDYTEVRAPFNGRIDRRLKDPGNLVGAGEETVLAEINQIDPIYVYFTINERDLLRVQGKHRHDETSPSEWKVPVSFGLANEKGYPHDGFLDFAAITIDPTTGTLLLRGIFQNPEGKILAGLFARVRAPETDGRNVVLVPEIAVGYDQMGPYVYAVDDHDTVKRCGVTLGVQHGDLRVVEKGLEGHERVIVDGLVYAIPGRVVTPVLASPATAGPSPEVNAAKGSGQSAQ